MVGNDLPPDPEDDPLVDALLGIRTTARLLGELRHSLEEQGFADDEVFALCETYLAETFCPQSVEED